MQMRVEKKHLHIEFIVTSHNSVIGDTYKKKGVKWGEKESKERNKNLGMSFMEDPWYTKAFSPLLLLSICI